MDIPLLLSGLEEVPLFSDPVKTLFNLNESIPEINTSDDIDALCDLVTKCEGAAISLQLPPVDLGVVEMHVTVIKPFVSQSDDEDDFI